MSESTFPLERRTARRYLAVHPAKVYDHRAQKYYPAQTSNLSQTGALLKVNRSMPLAVGDELAVGIAAGAGQTILSGDDLARARVVRVIPLDHLSQAVAVTFGQSAAPAQPEPASEGRAAA